MRWETTLVHCEIESRLPIDAVITRLEAALGAMDGDRFKYELAASTDGANFLARMRGAEGSSGFMTFFKADHGAWMTLIGQPAKARLYVLGNPLIARTMLIHDISVGLNVPVRLIVYQLDGEPGARLAYDLPSSLMAYTANSALLEAARQLDAKLAALAELAADAKA